MLFASALSWVLLLLPAAAAPQQGFTGTWHARLVPSAGHEVPFEIRFAEKGGHLSATLVNGDSAIPFTKASVEGGSLTLALDNYDARIEAKLKGEELAGTYTRVIATGKVELPFEASRTRPREVHAVVPGAPSLSGDWGVTIGSGDRPERALGVFTQKGGALSGTLRTPTGDYGSLHGWTDGKSLVLTTFDGMHVYRFDGTVSADGALAGEYRTRSNPPVPWTARRVTASEAAQFNPDASAVVRAKNPAAPYRFSYPDASGKTVSSEDFAGKPLLLVFFGTWCPNCSDEAPVLRELHRKYAPKGLEIVALAFEYTDDVERNRRQIARFRERFGVTYPILVAGTTQTAPTSAAMTQLDGWQGYPTTLYLDRSHRIVASHSGFDGPATGEAFTKLRKQMEATVQRLLD